MEIAKDIFRVCLSLLVLGIFLYCCPNIANLIAIKLHVDHYKYAGTLIGYFLIMLLVTFGLAFAENKFNRQNIKERAYVAGLVFTIFTPLELMHVVL